MRIKQFISGQYSLLSSLQFITLNSAEHHVNIWNENTAVLNQTALLAGTKEIQLKVQYVLFALNNVFLQPHSLMYHSPTEVPHGLPCNIIGTNMVCNKCFIVTMHVLDPCRFSHTQKNTKQSTWLS